MFRNGLLVFSLSFPVLAVSAVAQQTSAVAVLDGTSFHNTREELQRASNSVPYDKRSPATLLLDTTLYRFNADGTMHYERRSIYRIDNQAGVDNWSEAAMQWEPWYEKPSEIKARVLRPDGTFAELDPKTITDAPINGDENDTYSSAHVRRAPLPGAAIGALVEKVQIVDQKRPYFAAGMAYRYRFGNNIPSAREIVTVEVPEGSTFHDAVLNLPGQIAVNRREEHTDGIHRILYSRTSLAPADHASDIQLNTVSPLYSAIEFGTGKSWKVVADEYAKMAEPQIVVEDVRSELPANLAVDTAEHRMDAIRTIVQQLHNSIRYTGVEFNEAAITPQRPSEVMKRHYGDCKDKASMLVAMLRAAGIPAHLALLNAGDNIDINPETAGLGRFNHAIVYVPDAGNKKTLWIDATAEYSTVGTLPYGDQGRRALVIAPTTTALLTIPEATSADSIVRETRTYVMTEAGPASAVEESLTTGHMDATYRSLYGGLDTKKIKDDLENYAKNQYLAKSLTKLEHTDGHDLLHPFSLVLKMDEVRRAQSGLQDAAVSVFPRQPLGSLPQWLMTEEKQLGPTATEEEKEDHAKAVASRAATYRFKPYQTIQITRVTVPTGFELRSLPETKTTALGGASLIEKYSTDKNTVTIELDFDSGKGILTSNEAIAMRDAIVQLGKRDAITLVWDVRGEKLIAAGKMKEGFEAHRAAIEADPKDPIPHARYARALLGAGVGDLAKQEARKAAALDPKSLYALSTEGWVLQHDDFGVRFGPGFDRAGAIAAFEQAAPLHTDDLDSRYDLAILYEFDARGIRYQSPSDLDKAIRIYGDLIEEAKKSNTSASDYRNNMAYALLYANRYKDLDAVIPELPAGINRNTLRIVSSVAQGDVSAGMRAADATQMSTEERSQAMAAAGDVLARLGLYKQASEILAAGVADKNGAQVARQVEMYKNLKRLPARLPLNGDATDPIRKMLDVTLSGDATRSELESLISHHAYASKKAFDLNIDKGMQSVGLLRLIASRSDMSELVLRDLILGGYTNKVSGSDAEGYRVIAQPLGAEPQHEFVVKENGAYKAVADDSDEDEVGNYALYALKQKDYKLAKSLLDWKRELLHKGGGDDSFSGPIMPRFWTVGSAKEGADSPEAMKLAAIAMLASDVSIAPHLPYLVKLRDESKGQRQTDLNFLLAKGYIATEDPKPAISIIKSLMEDDPDSETLLNLLAAAYTMSNNVADWRTMLDARLAKKPGDVTLLRQKEHMLTIAGDYAGARATCKQVLESGKEKSNDYNSYAWSGLFDNTLSPEIVQAAQKANMMSQNKSFADLHTLASIYAAMGKTTEARQVLKQTMEAGNLSQPNSPVWYVLGVIYEQYGLRDAAIHAYQQVKGADFTERKFVDPGSSYILAQMQLKKLEAK